MLYGIYERLIQGNEKIGLLRFYDPKLFDAFDQILQHNVHQRENARQLELNYLVQILDDLFFIDKTGLVIENGRDKIFQLFLVKSIPVKIRCTELKCLNVLI